MSNEINDNLPVKRKSNGRNSPVIGDNGIITKPGDNSKYAGILSTVISWGNVDKSNINELEDRFKKIVSFCMEHDIRMTNQLVYLGIGITKDDVYEWSIGKIRTKEHTDFIKKVKAFCATYREMLGADGKLNPITLVWWQKNYDGMVDRQEVVLTPNNPLGDGDSEDEIAKRLLESK